MDEITRVHISNQGFPDGSSGKESDCNAGDSGDAALIPGSERVSGGGNGNPLQYSCLENPVDRGAWRATVHEVTESWTRLSKHFYSFIKKMWKATE